MAGGGLGRGDAGLVGDPGRIDPGLGQCGRGVVREVGEDVCLQAVRVREAFLLCFGLAVGICFRVCEAVGFWLG